MFGICRRHDRHLRGKSVKPHESTANEKATKRPDHLRPASCFSSQVTFYLVPLVAPPWPTFWNVLTFNGTFDDNTWSPKKKWQTECYWSNSARAQSPLAGSLCYWQIVFWSFVTKTKKDQALIRHVHGKIWPCSTQFGLGFLSVSYFSWKKLYYH